MKLKGMTAFLSLIFLIQLASAQFFDSYGFSPANFLASIDAQTIFILVAFGVFGLLLKTILDRFQAFRGTTAGIISVLLSIGMTWWINKWLNVNDLFSGFGFSGDLLSYFLVALLIIFIISLFVFKWRTLLIFGLLLILVALFTDLVYEKGVLLVIGAVLIIIGLIWWWKSRKKKMSGGSGPQSPQQQVIYKQRQRSLYDLKQKYMSYLFYYNRRGLMKHQRKRILHAMNIIIDYAKKVGVSKREFLSSKIGGSNAKAPEDLRRPFDG